jgi:hypothetical protein
MPPGRPPGRHFSLDTIPRAGMAAVPRALQIPRQRRPAACRLKNATARTKNFSRAAFLRSCGLPGWPKTQC